MATCFYCGAEIVPLPATKGGGDRVTRTYWVLASQRDADLLATECEAHTFPDHQPAINGQLVHGLHDPERDEP